MNLNSDCAAGIRKMKNLWENCPKFKMSTFLENTNTSDFHYDSKSFFPSNRKDYSKYDNIAHVIKEKNSRIGQELESIRETLRRCSQLNETILYNENVEPNFFPEVVSLPLSKPKFPCCRCNCQEVGMNISAGENLEPNIFPAVVNQPLSKPKFPCCRCNCQEVGMNISAGDWRKQGDDVDPKEDLHEIARNLSTTLLELNSCKICKSFPEELKETVGTLKSLLDYVNEKTSNTKLSVSRIENVKSCPSDISQDDETIFEDAVEGFSPKMICSKQNDHLDLEKAQISVKSCQCNFPTNVGTQKDMEEKLTKETETEKSLEPSNHKITVYKKSPSKVFDEKSKEIVEEFLLEAISVFDKINNLDSMEEVSAFSENAYGNQILNNLTKSELEQSLSSTSCISYFSSKIGIREIPQIKTEEDWKTLNFQKSEEEIIGKPVVIENVRSELKFSIRKSEYFLKSKYKRKLKQSSVKSKSLTILAACPEITTSKNRIKSEPKTKFVPQEQQLKALVELKTTESNSKSDRIKSAEIKKNGGRRPKTKIAKLKNECEARPDKTLPEVPIEKNEKVSKIQNIFSQPKRALQKIEESSPKIKNKKEEKIFKIVELNPKNSQSLAQKSDKPKSLRSIEDPNKENKETAKLSKELHSDLDNPKKALLKMEEGSPKIKNKNDDKIFKIVKLNPEDSLSLAQKSDKPKSLRSIEDPHKENKKTANLSKELHSDLDNPAITKPHLTSGSETISNEKVDLTLKLEDNTKTMKKSKVDETDFRANVIKTLNKSNKNVINVLAKVNKNVKEALESANQNLKIVLDVAMKQKITKANLKKKMEESEKVRHPKERRKKIAFSNGRKNLDLGNKERKVQTVSTIIKVQKYNNEDFYRFYRRQRRLVLFNSLETISDVDESLLADQEEEVFPIQEQKTPLEIKPSTDATEKIRESKRKILTKRKRRSTTSKNLEMEINRLQRDSSQVTVSNKPESKLEPPHASLFPIISSKPKYIPKIRKCQLSDEIILGKSLGATRNASLDTLADVVSITQYEVSVDTPEERLKMEPEFGPELQEFENLNFDQIFGDNKIHPTNCDCFDCLCKQYKKLNVQQNSDHSQNCCCLRCVEEILRIKNKNLDRKNKAYFEQQFNNCKQTVEKLKKEVKQLGLASRMTIQNISRKSDVEQTFLAKSRSSIQLTLTGLKVALNCLQSNCNKNEHIISHIFKSKQLNQNSSILSNLLTEVAQEKVPDRNFDNAGDQMRPVSRSETKVKQVTRNITEGEGCPKFTSGNATKLISSEPNLGKINVRKMHDENRKPKSPLRGKRSNRDLKNPNKIESEQYKLCNCEENLRFPTESNLTISKQTKRKIILPRYNACWRPTSIKVQSFSTFKKKNLKIKRFAKFNRSPKFESKTSLKTSKSKKEFVAEKIVPVKPTTSECPKGLLQNELDTILNDLFQAIDEIESIKHVNQRSRSENVCTRNQTSLITLLNKIEPISTQNSRTKPNELQFESVFTTKIAPKLDKKKVAEEKSKKPVIQKKLTPKKLPTVDKNLINHPYAESISTLFNLCTNWENKFKKNSKQVKAQPRKPLNATKTNNFAYIDLLPSKYYSNETTPVKNKKTLSNRNQKIKVCT